MRRTRWIQRKGYRKNGKEKARKRDSRTLIRVTVLLLSVMTYAFLTASGPAFQHTFQNTYQNTFQDTFRTAEVTTVRAVAGTTLTLRQNAAEALAEGLAACSEEIDLSAWEIPSDELAALFTSVMNSHPELFHVGTRMGYSYNRVGLVLTVKPTYTLTGRELDEARLVYRTTLDIFCTELDAARQAVCQSTICPSDKGDIPVMLTVSEPDPWQDTPGADRQGDNRVWSEADTVLFLHDWLADRYAYDTSGTRFDAYRLFRDSVGVCQAYALAFMALGQAAGLSVDMVTSTPMDHAWNHVRVDGTWYHVDVTRDDPVPVQEGSDVVNHSRLLLDDKTLQSLGYHDYTCSGQHVCVDTHYLGSDGLACLSACHQALLALPGGWFSVEGALPRPVAWPPADASEDISALLPGDINRDGLLSMADLLTLHALLPEEAYLQAMREALLSACTYPILEAGSD